MNTHRMRRSVLVVVGVAAVLLTGALATQPASADADSATAMASAHRTIGQTTNGNHGIPGQCTDGALRKFHEATGLWPLIEGNAADWNDSASSHGWTVVQEAERRAIVVFEPGVQGAHGSLGHVAWVDQVEQRPDGRWIHITEMNGAAGPGRWNTRIVKDIAGMNYILAPLKRFDPANNLT